MAREFDYRRLTAAEFRDALNRLQMTRHVFAKAIGLNPRTVLRWQNGDEEPPHWIAVLVEVLAAAPGAKEAMWRVTDERLLGPSEAKERQIRRREANSLAAQKGC